MKNEKTKKLYLVDDDALFLKVLEFEFLNYPEFSIETFPTAELCIKQLSPPHADNVGMPDMVVLDYHLDSIDKNAMNGLQALEAIKKLVPDMPVIMLSSQDKIEVAVNCMKHRAYDYI